MKNNEILQYKEAENSRRHLQRVFDDLISHKPPVCPETPRKPPFTFSLFVLGGYQRQSLSMVECFKKSTQTWERCADMSIPRSGVVCLTLSLYIYVIGGRNNSALGSADCADVECYNPFLNEWRRCAPMSLPRSRGGTGVIDGMIYAVGGAHGPEFHASVERYA
jgi:kelch-like protein 19